LKVGGGLPKLSEFVRMLSPPEDQFESLMSGMGLPVIPGPSKMAASFMETFEETGLPPAPPLPAGFSAPETPERETGMGETGKRTPKTEFVSPKKRTTARLL